MEKLSIPFAAGAALGALLPSLAGFPRGTPAYAEICLFLCAVAMALICYDQGRKWLYPLLFFLLGMFCYCSYAIIPERMARTPRLRGAAGRLRELIRSIPYSNPQSPALVCAVLTGDRGGLDREVTEAFRASGASHILALSGLHMGFIYMLVRSTTAFLGYTPAARALRCVLGIAFAVMFTIATGASPSAQRACIFIILRELAAVSQVRRSPPAHSLCTALLLQLAFRPDFISNAGFQLSYLAMAGIVFIHPVLKAWYPAPDSLRKGRLDPARRIWETASLSISCQIFTAPAAYLHFGTFPKYFLLTNLISLPLTSVIMALSAGVTLLWGLGICPAFLIRMNEKAIELLISSLRIISGM